MCTDKNSKTRNLLIAHIQKYPKLEIQDIFKFIYHSAFGCEHLVTSMEAVRDYIVREYNGFTHTYMEDVEVLDGEYSRVSLSLLSQGLSVNTLATLFYISSRDKAEEKDGLTRRLDVVRELARDGITPFSTDALEKAINAWAQKGYPAIHHSDKFREEYVPSYRVISNRFIPFLPLFIEIDKKMANGKVALAIEGGSASGKTTLGNILYEIYGCTVFHMDDFFLQPHQRTPERYSEIGGNVDRERFLSEVLKPLKNGEEVSYRRFDCSTMKIVEPQYILPKKLTVIEGAYSMHPELSQYYDISAFIDISEKKQRERILVRNTPEFAERFFEKWIPLEKVYFEKMSVRDRCNIVIEIK